MVNLCYAYFTIKKYSKSWLRHSKINPRKLEKKYNGIEVVLQRN